MHMNFLSDINKEHYYNLHYPKMDAFMIRVLWCHFLFVVGIAAVIYIFDPASSYPSPFSWRTLSGSETLWVVALAALSRHCF
jgi:hypothetical protein